MILLMEHIYYRPQWSSHEGYDNIAYGSLGNFDD